MSLLRLLDVSGLFWPIWRAKEGANRPIGEAAAETVQALRERAAAGDADYIVACCDMPGRTFRHDVAEEYKTLVPEFRGYKGHRGEKDAALIAAMNRVIDELEQDGVPVMRAEGFEADDVIATIAHWATANGHDVEVVSDDKDLLSLVVDPDPNNAAAPSVVVVRRDGTRQDSDACVARIGVPPALVPAFLALNGDKSDGVIGIPYVGETWAVRLLWGRYDDAKQWRPTPFKRFDDIVSAAIADQAALEANERERADARERKVRPLPPEYKAKFPENVRKSLIANAAAYDIGLRLTTLRTDVPLDMAAVTAPRVPKKDPVKAAERDALLRRAQEEAEAEEQAAADAAQEEKAMTTSTTTTIDAEYADPKPEPAQPVNATPVAPVATTAAAPAAQNTNAAAKPAQTTALARVPERPFEQQLEARNLTEAQWLAKSIAASRKIKDAGDENAVLLKLTVGRSLGMSLYQCLRMYLMEGQVTMRTQQVLARVKSSPLCDYIRKKEGDDMSCTWVTKRRGEPEQSCTFTIEKARRAMLGGIKEPGEDFDPKSAWAKWPEDMLSARAVMPLMRQEYPELVDGYSMEELGDDPRDAKVIDTIGEAA
jgi:5'-3' exonuclease